jgi:predicted nucleic acid-binding protein
MPSAPVNRVRRLKAATRENVITVRRSGKMRRLLTLAAQRATRMYIPAGVLAQVWRGGRGQQPLAALLSEPYVTVVPLDEPNAKAAGELCGRQGTADAVDASVALCARAIGSTVVTIDPGGLRQLDPRLAIEII